MRIFISINLPEEIKTHIADKLISKISPKLFKPVSAKNLHLTLSFLGEQNPSRVQKVINAIKEIDFEDFEIELRGIGHFGKKVIWIGIGKGKIELVNLAKIVLQKTEDKTSVFSAHLTIARARNDTKETEKLVQELKSENFTATFNARKICVMKSDLETAGPFYTELECKTLSSKFSGS